MSGAEKSHKALTDRLIKAQYMLAMARNEKEFAAEKNPAEYANAVRRYHVAKRALQRATAALAEVQ
jgi:hypothetical protein